MFICESCHDTDPSCNIPHIIKSYGECEVCGEIKICYECQYHHIEAKIFDELYIENWVKEHSSREDPLFLERLRNLNLTKPQIVGVLEAILTTCNHCWDGKSNCQCWNDE